VAIPILILLIVSVFFGGISHSVRLS
jgi:hypothetical protein